MDEEKSEVDILRGRVAFLENELATARRDAFLTGSRAYGKPTAKSDIDIVTMVDEMTRSELYSLSTDEGFRGGLIYLNNVNLIALCDPVQYDAWRRGTRALCRTHPAPTREEAIAVLQGEGVDGSGYCDELRDMR